MLDKDLIAREPPDMRNGIDSLYVYCDIVEPQIVGNGMHQLLDTVAVSGNFGDIIDRRFSTPHYIPLLAKQFDSISFTIKDDLDRLIPFNFGKCIIKLHFRRRR